jgi:hypothetical protein
MATSLVGNHLSSENRFHGIPRTNRVHHSNGDVAGIDVV